MIENVTRIKIDSEDARIVERAWYEYEGLKLLVTQFTSEGTFKPDNEKYSIALDRYLSAHAEYMKQMNRVTHIYIPEYVVDKNYNYTIDFDFQEICVWISNGCSGHDCKCKETIECSCKF